jgi:hypothetical protein|tara:strand:- start:146 stop:436 length:291 start_codon:yes stop_codon:yes gene_type:complete
VQGSVRGRGTILFKYWDSEKVSEMFYREMLHIRDNCEFGAVYKLWGDWALIAYVRRDSPHRELIMDVFPSSKLADNDLDLTQFYDVNPRTLGSESE